MTMTLQRQAEQSGLCFMDSDNNSLAPHWNTNDWPPLLGGWRRSHASVVLDHPEQDDRAQTVVFLGGYNNSQGYTNSVLLMNLAEENKQWREGPPLNNRRCCHAAVVCNGGVYVIGGFNGSSLNSIERIDVETLSSGSLANSTTNQWTTLNCRLSTAREGCSAVVVYNRYIVVMGGHNGHSLSSVDIIDTAVESNHTVIAGPSMTGPRYGFASAVIGHRIYVVGGHNGSNALTSVESLQFEEISDYATKKTAATVFSSSSVWTNCTELALPVARSFHAVVSVGSCIIVSGNYSGSIATVEVLDTERGIVWNLPALSTGRNYASMVAFKTGIAVIGGQNVDSCETLLLIDKKEQLKVRLVCVHYCTRDSLALSGILPFVYCRTCIRVERN